MSICVYLHLECIYFIQISEMYLNQLNMAQVGNKHQNSLYSTSDYGSMSTLDQSTLDLTTSMSACSEYGSLMTLNHPENSPFESIKKPQVMVNSFISKYKINNVLFNLRKKKSQKKRPRRWSYFQRTLHVWHRCLQKMFL
jgi:hypothetical protein